MASATIYTSYKFNSLYHKFKQIQKQLWPSIRIMPGFILSGIDSNFTKTSERYGREHKTAEPAYWNSGFRGPENERISYIFEFKMRGTANSALAQIEKNHYDAPYMADPRPKVKVGVRFTSAKHTITSWKIAR